MADHAADGEIFIYMGGRAPQRVTRVRIDKSVKETEERAFWNNRRLLQVQMHDGITKVGKLAFNNCQSMRAINLLGVKVVEDEAFYGCRSISDLVGDKLETIGGSAFEQCTSLMYLTIPSGRIIDVGAFPECIVLTGAELPEGLETGEDAFFGTSLRRIVIPLKDDMIEDNVFEDCA